MKIKKTSYLDEKGKLSKDCKYEIPDAELIKAYETMLLTRHSDERMLFLQRQGYISFAMSSLGEEGCIVASAAALQNQDWMFPQYREVGILLWRGYPIQDFVHHMFCNAKDNNLGRQMPNHFGSKELNVVTVSSPLATQIPQTAGCAQAMKLRKEDAVAIAYFGEGAASKSDFHTGLNFAAVRKVPAIFFCRNNGYAISTPTKNQYASDDIASKGEGYGIKALQVDGNDYFAVHEAVAKARKHCISGKGPVLIEAMTYRLGAHSTSDDPSAYRSDEDLTIWQGKCPIKRLRLYLENRGLWDDRKEEQLQEHIKRELDKAIEIAKKTPPPHIETLIRDVYSSVPSSLEEQLTELQSLSPEVVSHD